MMESLRLGLDGIFLEFVTVVAEVGEAVGRVVDAARSAFELDEVEFLLPRWLARRCQQGVTSQWQFQVEGRSLPPIGQPSGRK